MSASSRTTTTYSPWLWVIGLGWSALIVGVGLWVAVSTGQWIAVLLALGLAAPIDVMLIRRLRRSGVVDAGK